MIQLLPVPNDQTFAVNRQSSRSLPKSATLARLTDRNALTPAQFST